MFTRRKLLGKQLTGAIPRPRDAASPDPAAAGSALRAHFSRGREKCGSKGRQQRPSLPESERRPLLFLRQPRIYIFDEPSTSISNSRIGSFAMYGFIFRYNLSEENH